MSRPCWMSRQEQVGRKHWVSWSRWVSGQCPASRQGSMGRPHWLDCQGRVSRKHWAEPEALGEPEARGEPCRSSRARLIAGPGTGPMPRNRGEARWSPRGGGRSARRPRTAARPRPTPRSSATPPSPRSADHHPGPHNPGRARRPHPPAPPEPAPSARYRTHPPRRIPGRAEEARSQLLTARARPRRAQVVLRIGEAQPSSPAGVQSCQAGQAIRSSSTASWPHGSSTRWPTSGSLAITTPTSSIDSYLGLLYRTNYRIARLGRDREPI